LLNVDEILFQIVQTQEAAAH